MKYSDRINVIKGIGEKTEKVFQKLGIETVQDLIEHYPRGYEEFQKPVPIAELREGETFTIEAVLFGSLTLRRVRNLKIINGKVKDKGLSFP